MTGGGGKRVKVIDVKTLTAVRFHEIFSFASKKKKKKRRDIKSLDSRSTSFCTFCSRKNTLFAYRGIMEEGEKERKNEVDER